MLGKAANMSKLTQPWKNWSNKKYDRSIKKPSPTNHIEKCHEQRQLYDDMEHSNGVYNGDKFFFQ